jgi:hypothetical protein
MKKLGLLICFLTLAGCQSEVDKCTDSFVKNGGNEAAARYECLKAASGKE